MTATPTEPDFDALSAVMHKVLDGVVATFEDAQVGLPDKQYIHIGAVAYDCEQLVVQFVQMYLGPPGSQAESPQKCLAPRSAVLTIHLVRCIPQPVARSTSPTAEAMTASAENQAQDAYLLMNAALNSVDDWLGVLADVSVTDPQGGYQGVMLNLVIGVA